MASDQDNPPTIPDDKQKKPENIEKTSGADQEDAEKIIDILGNGQLVKTVLLDGDQDLQPARGDLCKVSFKGRLENGRIVDEQTDLWVQVGDVEIVQGLDMSLPLMRVGEKAEVVVDPRFGYGSVGLEVPQDPTKSIPPNAMIIYHLHLIDSKEEDDLENKSYSTRQIIGNRKRERGNFWYERNEFNLAIQLYRRALEYLDDTDRYVGEKPAEQEMTNDQLQELLEIRVKVYNNLAAAQMKISAFDAALISVDNVLRCQPENVKALFRKGKILEAKGDIKAAIPVLQKGAILDPESKAIQQLLSKCIMKQRREARNEKDLYQKMLGHTQKLEEKGKTKQSNRDAPKLKLWGYLGSILIVVAGVAIYRYKYF